MGFLATYYSNWDDPPSIGGETSMKMLWIFYPEGVGVNDSQIWWLHIFQMGEQKLPTGIYIYI